ncbi:MAG TPA: 4-(cytidine 5'-diphospho)-2-C-methyl-D-erythritol kinase [Chloroflexota bacterium]|nr:4-(cytidine 5'-diphospho)-2-C-methyl-D-erythritol kinase [Chloroflexota bacterium]
MPGALRAGRGEGEEGIRELAPAKLNLVLEVLGRREDGYHELATVFQTVGLCDELRFWPDDALTLEVDDPALAGEENLVLRAARRLRDRVGFRAGARIRLTKRIPAAAGLGGGSSDAAAALRGLRRLWRLGLEDAELAEIAAGLGADVPFLLRGGTALAGGVGDRLDPLPDLAAWAVLYTPPYRVADKTVRAYRALRTEDWSDGSAAADAASAVRAGRRPDLGDAPNAFERVADELFPGLAEHRARLTAAGAPWVRLSGAGPTLFTLTPRRRSAEAIRARLPAGVRAWAVPTVGAAQS